MDAGPYTARRSDTALNGVVALLLLAAIAHLSVVPEHLEEWWGYGVFFLVAAVAQGLYALALLRWFGRPMLLLGVGGNLAVVILWLVTRTTGIPLLGPHAGEVEEVGVLGLACTLAEVGAVAALLVLATRSLPTQGRIQVMVVLGVSALLYWHLLHLLAGSVSH